MMKSENTIFVHFISGDTFKFKQHSANGSLFIETTLEPDRNCFKMFYKKFVKHLQLFNPPSGGVTDVVVFDEDVNFNKHSKVEFFIDLVNDYDLTLKISTF